MDWVGRRLEEACREGGRGRGDGMLRLREAEDHLYAAQSRQSFGAKTPDGSPLASLRRETFQHLLRAERTLDELEPRPFAQGASARGMILLRSRLLTLRLEAGRESRLVELSDKLGERDLLDIRMERGPAARPGGGVDHAFSPGASVREMARGQAQEMKGLFGARAQGRVERSGRSVRAVITSRGRLLRQKTVTLRTDSREVLFTERLENLSRAPVTFLFGSELILNLKDAHVNRIGEVEDLSRFSVVDPAARLEVGWSFSRPARLWHFPLESLGPGRRGAPRERAYQGVSLTALWPVELAPHAVWQVRWELVIHSPDGG